MEFLAVLALAAGVGSIYLNPVEYQIAFYEPMKNTDCLMKAIEQTSEVKFTEIKTREPILLLSLPGEHPSKSFHFKINGLDREGKGALTLLYPFENVETDSYQLFVWAHIEGWSLPEKETITVDKALQAVRKSVLKLCGPMR